MTAPAPVADAVVGDPFARGDIADALRRVHAEVEAAFAGVDDAALDRRPSPDKWSPAENLAHLALAVAPVARGLRLPKWLPRLLFGAAATPSRRYAEMRETYRGRLAGGAKSTAAYLPRVDVGAGGDLRERLLARWRRAGEALLAALEGWDEASLDRVRFPHPILGKLTVREMLFFTLYHDLHHAAAIRRAG